MKPQKNKERLVNKIKQYIIFNYYEDGSFCIEEVCNTKEEADKALARQTVDSEIVKVTSKKPIKGKMKGNYEANKKQKDLPDKP